MPNPSRSRLTLTCADVRLTLLTAALSLTLAAGPIDAATKKHVPVAPPLPNMPITHPQKTTTTTTTTVTTSTTKADSYTWAAPPPKLPTTTLYDGGSAGVSVLAWGGGSGGVSTDMSYNRGGHAIKVVTHGLYEGVKLNFTTPAPFSEDAAKNRIFQVLVRFGQASDSDEDTGKADLPQSAEPRRFAVSGGPSLVLSGVFSPSAAAHGWIHTVQGAPPGAFQRPGGYPGGGYPGGAYPGGGYPGGGYPGGYPGGAGGRRGRPQSPPTGGYPGAGGYPGGYPGMPGYGRLRPNPNADTAWNPQLHFFRFLFTLQDGSQAEIIRPTPYPIAFEDPDTAWLSIGIPLSLLKFTGGQGNSPLASITIGGDGPSTFYIGQMNLVDDDSPITCSAGPGQDVASGDEVTLTARAQGGASMLTYSWDFDASDGIIDEADGATVTHAYAKGNKDYTVTLTVSDLDGIKKPCTSTTKIKVEE